MDSVATGPWWSGPGGPPGPPRGTLQSFFGLAESDGSAALREPVVFGVCGSLFGTFRFDGGGALAIGAATTITVAFSLSTIHYSLSTIH